MTDPKLLFKDYLTEAEYRAERKIGKRQAQRERQAGKAPPWFKIGKQIYYSIPGARRYAAAREVEPGTPPHRASKRTASPRTERVVA